MTNVFIIGSKGIPANYGGFETFVENLTKRKKSNNIKYFVSCMGKNNDEFDYNDAHCFTIALKKESAFHRVLNVSASLKWVEKYIKNNVKKDDKNIVYILGCRIGLLMSFHRAKLHKLGCIIMCNPDGLEWKRDKWNRIEKKILLISERKLIKNSDYVVCDSVNIQKYVLNKYNFLSSDKTCFIAYGSDVKKSTAADADMIKWLKSKGTSPKDYFLIIGRFVPENNYELMIREFMKSKTTKKLLIITNVEKNKFYEQLSSNLGFENDNRIIFAGTLYDSELVKKIRENAFAYLHGHSVGGTNPSLLEAMASTNINILYDVSFNREVGGNQCLYFNSDDCNLSNIVDTIDSKYNELINQLNSQSIVIKKYSWDKIVADYEKLFLA